MPSQTRLFDWTQRLHVSPTDGHFNAQPQVCHGFPCPHLVSEDALMESGFRGWWEPVERLIGSISVEGVDVFVAATSLWHGSARGHH